MPRQSVTPILDAIGFKGEPNPPDGKPKQWKDVFGPPK
jgi:hypothetical protein